MIKTVFIGLGSNLGDKTKNCERAVYFLEEHPDISIIKVSKWYKSKALTMDDATHPDFINGAVQIETDTSPIQLATYCKSIEYELGRIPDTRQWQPRVIDLDILFFGNEIVQTNHLTIPHPSLHQRLFVLKPLSELMPQWIHPVLNKTVAELLEEHMVAATQCSCE